MSDIRTKEQLLSVLGEDAPAKDLTALKTAFILQRDNAQITGFIVQLPGGMVGLVDKSACRWLFTQKEWWDLFHPEDRPEEPKPRVIEFRIEPDHLNPVWKVAEELRKRGIFIEAPKHYLDQRPCDFEEEWKQALKKAGVRKTTIIAHPCDVEYRFEFEPLKDAEIEVHP